MLDTGPDFAGAGLLAEAGRRPFHPEQARYPCRPLLVFAITLIDGSAAARAQARANPRRRALNLARLEATGPQPLVRPRPARN